MLAGTKVDNTTLDALIEKLKVKNELDSTSYETSNREDYFTLVSAALSGKLEGVVSVGRSGIYLNKHIIQPPTDA